MLQKVGGGYIPFSSDLEYYNFNSATHSRFKIKLFDLKIDVPLPQKAPFYRYYHPSIKVHFYTTHPGGEVAPRVGYRYDGFVGYIDTKQILGTTPLHRWYNPYSHDHFYTTAIQGELAGASPVISSSSLPQPMVIRR